MAKKILNIIPKYARFFIENNNERYLILQGSRRSGKSISCYQWLTLKLLSSRKECAVLTATYPAATNAMKDFTLATGLPVNGNAIYGHCHIFENGSVIYFKAFDQPQKAQGTYADFAIVEEALNIEEQIFTVFSMSIREQIYFLYNPTKTSWTDKYLAPDKHNYLKTTFKDNPYLTDVQLQEFELIKKRAESPNASILDIYNKKVYYDGDFSDMSGKVFMQIYTISDDEFDKIDAQPFYGLDFGFVDSRDQTALVAVKIHNHCLYIKELLFDNSLTNDMQLALRLSELGFDEYTTIVADFGGLGATKIRNLRSAGDGTWTDKRIVNGFDVINCTKHKIVDDIQTMLQYDRIYVTENSINLRREMNDYTIDENGKAKGEDHLIDSARYATTYARVNQDIF